MSARDAGVGDNLWVTPSMRATLKPYPVGRRRRDDRGHRSTLAGTLLIDGHAALVYACTRSAAPGARALSRRSGALFFFFFIQIAHNKVDARRPPRQYTQLLQKPARRRRTQVQQEVVA
jgi:hypothetical protein